jgi:hypothetical protein
MQSGVDFMLSDLSAKGFQALWQGLSFSPPALKLAN